MRRFVRLSQFALATLMGSGVYYVNKHKISLTNPFLDALLSTCQKHKPELAKKILKALIRFQILIDDDNKFKEYVLESGFDEDGRCLQGITQIGFQGSQIGPVSWLPACAQQQSQSFGLLYVLANISTFRMMHMQSQHKIGVNLAPNYEIVKYAPYLIKENILNAVKEITKLQLSCSFKLTDYVILNFGEKSMQGLDSNPELQCMLIEAITESSRVLATTGIQLHVSVAPKYDRVIPQCLGQQGLVQRFIVGDSCFRGNERRIKQWFSPDKISHQLVRETCEHLSWQKMRSAMVS